jgi:hypothetical protein
VGSGGIVGKVNQNLNLSGSSYGSTKGRVYLNNINLSNSINTWNDTLISLKIPSWMPRGYYTKKIYDSNNNLIDSVTQAIRITTPSISGGE